MTIPKVFEDLFASAVDVRGVGNFLPLERDVDEVPHGDEKWIPCVIQQSTSSSRVIPMHQQERSLFLTQGNS